LQRALVAAHSAELGESGAAACLATAQAAWRSAYRRWWGFYN
jgi:hypothetical protein